MKRIYTWLFCLLSLPLCAQWLPLGEGVTNTTHLFTAVYAMAEFQNELYIGGCFTHVDGVAASFIAKWDGSQWASVGEGLSMSNHAIVYSGVRTLKVFNGELYAGGIFDRSGTQVMHHLAKWNGTEWIDLGLEIANDPGAGVLCLETYQGKLYAGGSFKGNDQYNSLARYDGAAWSKMKEGVQQTTGGRGLVRDLRTYGGLLYIGGQFDQAGAEYSENLITWDGTDYHPVGFGAVGNYGITQSGYYGPQLIIAGGITQIFGVPVQNIGMFNTMTWENLGAGLGSPGGNSYEIQAMTEYQDALFVGGSFVETGELALAGIARWDGSEWSPFGTFSDGAVLCLQTFQGALVAGGSFTTADKSTIYRLAWINPPTATLEKEESNPVITVFPNPTEGRLHLQFRPSTLPIDRIELVHPLGWIERVQHSEIDLSTYLPGIYYLKIYTDDGIFVEKVLKMTP